MSKLTDALQPIIAAAQARAKKALDANNDGKVDAADFELMATIAKTAAEARTDSWVQRFGSLPVFLAGVAAGGGVATFLFVRFGG